MTEWDDPVVQKKVKAAAAKAEASDTPPVQVAPEPVEAVVDSEVGVPAGSKDEGDNSPASSGSLQMKVAPPHGSLQVGFAGPMLTTEFRVVGSEVEAALLRNAAEAQGVEIIEEIVP